MPTSESPELQRWNGRFLSTEYVFGTAPNAFLASQAHRLAPGQRALAVADGEGRNGVWLAKQGLDVLSVDFSSVGLAKAQNLAADAGVELNTKCVDLAAWSWDEPPFDVVVAIFIQFADPALRATIFQRMKDALKPGGLILLAGYRPEQLDYRTGGPSQLENLYTAPMLRDAFSDTTILHLAEYDDEINEGAGHSGMSALIDLVARK
jgi:cyclopropane fatty-acyl-phospholipid synthase-like methyltransferase